MEMRWATHATGFVKLNTGKIYPLASPANAVAIRHVSLPPLLDASPQLGRSGMPLTSDSDSRDSPNCALNSSIDALLFTCSCSFREEEKEKEKGYIEREAKKGS
jgi:hypothetical protein